MDLRWHAHVRSSLEIYVLLQHFVLGWRTRFMPHLETNATQQCIVVVCAWLCAHNEEDADNDSVISASLLYSS